MNERDYFTTRNVALGLAGLLILAFFGPAIGTESFFYRDFGVLAYPTASYHREMFWQGELPLWNPYSNCGVPFLAQWGTMTLYPFTLIYLLLPFPWSLNLFCLVHLWWGAMGVFKLAQRWTDSSPAAAVAATLFQFNGITLSTLSWPNYTAAFAWMPWIIFFSGGGQRRRTAAFQNLAELQSGMGSGRQLLECGGPMPLLLATAGTMQMLVGAPEIAMLTWLLALALHLRKTTWAPICAAVLLVAGLCAIQLLPFFELLSLSHRQPGAVAGKWSMPFAGVGNFLLPMLHAFRTPQNTWFQHEQHFLSSTYLGMPAVMLAAIGAIRGGRIARTLLAATLVCVILAFGTNLPAFAALQQVPMLGLARYPIKFVLLLAFTVPLAAAFGVKAIASSTISLRLLLIAFATVLVVSIALFYWTLAHPYRFDAPQRTMDNSLLRFTIFIAACSLLVLWLTRPHGGFAIAIAALIVVDGRFHLPNQNPTAPVQTLREPIGTRPLPKLGEGRVFISREAENSLLRSGVTNLNTDFIGKQLAVWSHLNLIELAPKVNGSATLQLREQKQLQDWLYSGTNVNFEAWLDFLGVTQITRPGTVVEWTNRTTAAPLLQLATQTSAAPFSDIAPAISGEGELKLSKFASHEIVAQIKSPRSQFVVVAQSWHPGWRATVNGAPKEIARGNFAFQAIEIPAGASEVRLRYMDTRFKIGAAISFLSLALCAALAMRKRRQPD